MQIIDGTLSVGGGLKDGAVVVLENLEPRSDIRGMLFLDFRRDFEIGTKKSGTQFGNEFLPGVAFVAPCLAAEVAFNSGRVPGPVGVMPISA